MQIAHNRPKLLDGSWYPHIPTICFCMKPDCYEICWKNNYVYNHWFRGKSSAFKGHKHTEASKKKNSISNIELFLLDEHGNKEIYPPIFDLCHCKRQSCNETVWGGNEFVWGHHNCCMPQEIKDSISEQMSGSGNPMYEVEPWCKGLTNETSEKMRLKSEKTSKSLIGIPMTEERRIKHAEERRLHPSMLGKHHTSETKEKQRLSKIGKKNPRYGKPAPDGAGYCKRYYYESETHGILCFKGSYEYKYVLYCDKNRISWLYQPKTFPLSDEMTYTPDFYLPSQDKYIEIKGYLYLEHKIKIEKFLKEYLDLKLEVLYNKDLEKFGIDIKIKLDQNLHLKGKQKLLKKNKSSVELSSVHCMYEEVL